MKIERGSITITDIPYFDSILITPTSIDLDRDGHGPIDYTTEEIEALRDALTEAIRIKREIDGTPIITASRVFSAPAAEPGPEVTKVRDRDGSDWCRVNDGWALRPSTYGNPWSDVLQYEPLTDVTNA